MVWKDLLRGHKEAGNEGREAANRSKTGFKNRVEWMLSVLRHGEGASGLMARQSCFRKR